MTHRRSKERRRISVHYSHHVGITAVDLLPSLTAQTGQHDEDENHHRENRDGDDHQGCHPPLCRLVSVSPVRKKRRVEQSALSLRAV